MAFQLAVGRSYSLKQPSTLERNDFKADLVSGQGTSSFSTESCMQGCIPEWFVALKTQEAADG